MENTKGMLARANGLLASGSHDAGKYGELENYVLKNDSRLRDDPDFQALKATLDIIAERQGFPSLERRRENFGLNSCAQ